MIKKRNRHKPPMPFSNGNRTFMNACVGHNGFVTNDSYFRGYKETVDVLYEYLNNNHGKHIDAIAYPFLYSCRHILELMLKEVIIQASVIKEEAEIRYKGTHSLKDLFDICKNKLNFLDRRFKSFVDNINDYILEIATIDDTGQTFRYVVDDKGFKHLINDKLAGIINLDVFYNAFIFIEDNLTEILNLLYLITKERKTGAFTTKLSRYDIEEISKKLPNKTEWINERFNDVREIIKEEYGLTSNKDFIKVVDIIKNHPAFSKNIGEAALRLSCNKSDFEFFFAKMNKIESIDCSDFSFIFGTPSHFESIQKTQEYRKLQETIKKEITEKLDNDKLKEIGALYILGRGQNESCYPRFPEFYEDIKNNLTDYFESFNDNSPLDSLLCFGSCCEEIKLGLQTLKYI